MHPLIIITRTVASIAASSKTDGAVGGEDLELDLINRTSVFRVSTLKRGPGLSPLPIFNIPTERGVTGKTGMLSVSNKSQDDRLSL